MLKNIKKLSIIACVIVAIIFLYFKFEVFKNSPKLSTYEIMPLIVLSGSMKPAINVGDIIFIKGINPNNIKVGDVITYRKDKIKTITHRIIAVQKTELNILFETKGDVNNVKDENKVFSDEIVGKVVFRIPYAGYFCDFINKNKELVLFIIPMIVIIGGELIHFLKQINK